MQQALRTGCVRMTEPPLDLLDLWCMFLTSLQFIDPDRRKSLASSEIYASACFAASNRLGLLNKLGGRGRGASMLPLKRRHDRMHSGGLGSELGCRIRKKLTGVQNTHHSSLSAQVCFSSSKLKVPTQVTHVLPLHHWHSLLVSFFCLLQIQFCFQLQNQEPWFKIYFNWKTMQFAWLM